MRHYCAVNRRGFRRLPLHLIKDIVVFERIQCRTAKYILNDYSSDYKTRLLSLDMLPLSYWFEIQDITFLIKCLKDPSDNMDIFSQVQFAHSNTRASTNKRLIHKFCRTTASHHFYFNRVVRLWNSFPSDLIDLSQTTIINKMRIIQFLKDHFITTFDSHNAHTFHFKCPCSNCIL